MTRLVLLSVLFLPACAPDKVLHAGAGLGIGIAGDAVLDGRGCQLAIATGLAKELIDPIFSLPDLLATSVYCILPILKEET